MKDEHHLLDYTLRYLNFCKEHDGSGTGIHHIVLRADGGTDEDNIVHLSVEDHKLAHEILYQDNLGVRLAQQAYSVTRGLGHPSTEEGRAKMRKAKLGKLHYQSQETKQNISKALTGKPLSEEHKRATARSVSKLWENSEYRESIVRSLRNRKNKIYHRVCKVCGLEFTTHACNAQYCENCKKERK